MTWKTIDPADVQPGDYIEINGQLTRITDVTRSYVCYQKSGCPMHIGRDIEDLGATYKRDVPDQPHGLIPTEHGAVIRLSTGEIYVRAVSWNEWETLHDECLPFDRVQTLADTHGFDVLWPRPEPEPVEITDEMVKRAAKVMCANSNDVPWDEETDGTTKAFYLGDARAALEAALGGEQ